MRNLPIRNSLERGDLTFEEGAYFPVFTVFDFVFFHVHKIKMLAGSLFSLKNEF